MSARGLCTRDFDATVAGPVEKACKNLTNYVARSLAGTYGFRPLLHPPLR